MAVTLIIYPEANANSFVSVINADAFINPLLNYASWEDLSEDDKSRRLIATYEKFILVKDFVPPTDLVDSCLPEAQSRQALYDLVYDPASASRSQQVRKESFGPMETEYFKNVSIDQLTIDDFPPVVVTCLSSYGASTLNIVGGVGVMRHSR